MRISKMTLRVMSYGLIFVCALVLLVWVIGRAREEARSSQCVCKLAQLALALHNYESTFGCFPPAAITDANGKALLSWRVAILPFMEEDSLYKQIKLDEPWDSPHNRRFHALRPPGFACPSHAGHDADGTTSYVVVVGPRTVFNGSRKGRSRAEIHDDPASTLVVVESSTSAINWMEPRDLEWDQMSFRVNDESRESISSEHHYGSYPGPHVAAIDRGANPDDTQVVTYLPESMPMATIRALLMIDDGEKIVLHRGPKRDRLVKASDGRGVPR
jgi:Protein of unknown function (DUF1559)